MATRVFISYRRDDSAGSAGRVHDRLERELGRDLLFMDVDAIPLGLNFVKVLRDEVAECDVLLAVIGPKWLDARDEHGNRRLDDPNDHLRIEIATALQRDIDVIPILVDGAKVPKADRLSEDLKELELRNGLEIRHASFDSDIDKLIQELKGPYDQAGVAPKSQRLTPLSSQTPGSVTIVERPTFRTYVVGSFAPRIKVFIDNKEVDRMKQGGTVVVPVKPGVHSMFLKLLWRTSNTLRFKLKPGQKRGFLATNTSSSGGLKIEPL